LTVRTLESSGAQTTITFGCKAGLTSCFVLAGVTNTRALLKRENERKKIAIFRLLFGVEDTVEVKQ